MDGYVDVTTSKEQSPRCICSCRDAGPEERTLNSWLMREDKDEENSQAKAFAPKGALRLKL